MTIEEIDALRPRKAVLYLRVSSKKQTETAVDIDKDGNSIATQRDVCRKKADSINAYIVEEFVEPGVSAKNTEDRPKFKELMRYLTEHPEIDYVIVYARSRAFRNFVDAAITRRYLDSLGIRLLSAREDFGDGVYAEAMEAVTDIMNQVQNQLSGEDIRIKMRNKAINGGTVHKAKLGYLNIRKDIDGRLINSIGLDDKRAPLVLKAFELYATGHYTIERLEETMGDMGLTSRQTKRYAEKPVSASRLHQILKDPYYVGFVVYKGELYPGRHEPIVGQDLFDEVQDVMAAKSGAGQRNRVHDHVLKGMIYCGKCKARGRRSRVIYTQVKGRGNTIHEYFFCRGRQEGDCTLPYVPAYVVEDNVGRAYGALVLDEAFRRDVLKQLSTVLDEEQRDLRAVRSSMTNELKKIDEKESRLIDLLAEGLLSKEKLHEKVYELRIQRHRAEDTLAGISEKIALGGKVLSTAIDQVANPLLNYEFAPEKVQRLMNETYFERFEIDEEGGVSAPLAEPFSGIFAAQAAFGGPVVPGTTTSRESTGSSRETANVGPMDDDSTEAEANKNGADFSTPPLVFNLASVYSNHGSNRATLVGMTGFEPATSSSRTKRATKLRYIPIR